MLMSRVRKALAINKLCNLLQMMSVVSTYLPLCYTTMSLKKQIVGWLCEAIVTFFL